MPSVETRFPALVGWALLAFLVLFWRLGEPTFWDPDEAHYAQSTREMIASGDWLAPTYNGAPFFDKPALFHQLQAVAMLAVGETELGARLVPACAALALIVMTGWLGGALVSRKVGLVAALLLTANPAVFALSRYAILDMLFTAFLFGGVALVTVAALRARAGLQWPGYVLIALATLTKGPLALALCGIAFLLALAVSADARRRFMGLRWVLGLLLVFVATAPWFLYMIGRFGSEFVEGYLLNENLRLFAGSPYANQPGWSFFLQIVAVGFLPWTPVLIGRLYDTVKSALRPRGSPTSERLDTVDLLLWCWVAAVIGLFSAAHFKLDHYVFPTAPALCLLCARAWADVQDQPSAAPLSATRVGLLCVGPIMIVGGLVAGYLLVTTLALPWPAFALPTAFIAAGALLTWGAPRARRLRLSPALVSSGFGILYAVAIALVIPAIEELKVVDDLARWTSAHATDDARICGYRLNRWRNSFLFYSGRPVAILDTPEELGRFMRDNAALRCVMPESVSKELAAAGTRLDIVHRADGLWVTSGRALWREKQTTGFVVAKRPTRDTSAGRPAAEQ